MLRQGYASVSPRSSPGIEPGVLRERLSHAVLVAKRFMVLRQEAELLRRQVPGGLNQQ